MVNCEQDTKFSLFLIGLARSSGVPGLAENRATDAGLYEGGSGYVRTLWGGGWIQDLMRGQVVSRYGSLLGSGAVLRTRKFGRYGCVSGI